ncbi:hypothetical protein [Mycolicibacterium psychrotolerans]|uniref:Uncharacterized protein n=1 Tax=Mycolicibacterium psychrotolerans TaxID=216929 RepID=A0A7I7MGW0_9MYCO|nr:hypothetical protein [Mycolicibacterium psychrotolerans]BBX71405.1 hypothetical protein MPSYJ_48660 [Mycolicibacterium psychrotolerans]
MPTLVLHLDTGITTTERERIDQYARRHGYLMVPAILDGDVCVKLMHAVTGSPPPNTSEVRCRHLHPAATNISEQRSRAEG